MNRFELLHVAKAQAARAGESRLPAAAAPRGIPVAGAAAIATFKAYMVNMLPAGSSPSTTT
jgi:hypothetical protein